ncbi:MAG TPA: efflux RND transporter permease subunit, partial [Thermoanaerobaculia bacterium]|nr:efflux RND transporter permease subunit [Thermoanaerobaculia bacterium]
VYGSQKYAVRVQLDPRQLASRGIGIDEVQNAVKNSNVNLPTGVMNGAYTAYTVQANGQLYHAADYRPITVAYRNGHAVHLDELGHVLDDVENDQTAAWFRDKRGLILAILKQPGTNTVEVADSIRSLLPEFRKLLPASVNLDIHRDRAESIRASVADVKFTLLLTLCLVVMVIFLFLRNVSATIIPSLALPLSVVGTFSVMYLLNYSLDNLSLMALTLSVGFVVDDAIVMLENIVRHMEMGKPPLQAAFDGSKEVGFTIISMTLSLAAVFIPVLFMGGILGRLFHEFAVTIGAAILVSGFVSLSLTPLLSSRFLRPSHEQDHGRLYQFTERGFEGLRAFYERGLRGVLHHRGKTLFASLALLAATAWLFVVIPKGFIPTEDQGQIFINVEAIQGIGFADLVRHQLAAADIVMHEPGVAAFFSSCGSRGSSNTGIISIRTTPKSDRDFSIEDIVASLRKKLSRVQGIRCYVTIPPPIRLGGRIGQSNYQFTMQAPETAVLYPASEAMLQKMRQMPGLVDVATDLQLKNPTMSVDIDRDRASALGLNMAQVEDALYSAYGTRQISTIYAPNNEYQVIMELEPQFQNNPSSLDQLYVRNGGGQLIPLSAVAKLIPSYGPLAVNHSGQLPSVTISFDVRQGVSLGDAINEINAVAKRTLPAAVSTGFQGTAQAFQSSLQGLGLLLVLAIAVIYMVLGIFYESFIHPITILSALP